MKLTDPRIQQITKAEILDEALMYLVQNGQDYKLALKELLLDTYTKTELVELLSEKVTVESGKGLSSNDFTDEDKQKLTELKSNDYLLDRNNQTGTQPITTIEGLEDTLVSFIEDAPKDSKQYVRKDGNWSEITNSGGGGATETEVKGWIGRNIAVNNAYSTFVEPPKVDVSASLALVSGSDAKGTNSIAIGVNAKTTTLQGIAVGRDANVTHSYGIAVGYQTQSAQGSVSLGQSGKATSVDCVAIGRQASSSFSSSMSLGVNSSVTATSQNQIGNSTTTTYVYGSVQDRSDVRDKTDIKDISLGLEFINLLRPVEYRWDYREDYFETISPKEEDFTNEEGIVDIEAYNIAYESARKEFFTNPVKDGSKKRVRYHTGLIAQELKQVLETQNIDFGGFQHHEEKGGLDVMSIGYSEFIAVLIKSVQELSTKVEEQKQRISVLENKMID